MVRLGPRKPSWSFPNYTARLSDYYYNHRLDLEKPSTRVHDKAPQTDFSDLIYRNDQKRV